MTITFTVSDDQAPFPRHRPRKLPTGWQRPADRSPSYAPSTTTTPWRGPRTPSNTPPSTPPSPPESPKYVISEDTTPTQSRNVTPTHRGNPPSPAEPQMKKVKLYSVKRRLLEAFSQEKLREKKATLLNQVYPLGIIPVDIIDTNFSHLPQVSKDLRKINISGIQLCCDTMPRIILNHQIEKTFITSHLMTYSRGVAKSATLNLDSDNLSLFEGDPTCFPNTLGLYIPTLFYHRGNNLIKLSNQLCPYQWTNSLRKIHHDRQLVNIERAGFKFTIVEQPKTWNFSPEGLLCKKFHDANDEVMPNPPMFSDKYLNDKCNVKYLILPSTPLLNATVNGQKFQLLQIGLYAKAYDYDEVIETVRNLTQASEERVRDIAASSSISLRELLAYMPNGIICLVIPSRICYKITYSELSRLLILSSKFRN